MKYLQTFWTGPSSQRPENLISMKAGWRSCEYHWMSWALSCLQAKKLFGEINLVTDLPGKEILVDRLKLPYSNVSTELETTLDHCDPRLWALAKIYTYSIQEEPFLHLDGDVFLWQKPSDEFMQSPLTAQNLDKDLPMYGQMLSQINTHFLFVPELLQKQHFENTTIYASNAGLLGGYNLPVIKKYCAQAFEFVEKNKDSLEKLPTGNLNFIFEQYLFCQVAASEGIEIAYLNGVVDNPVFKDYIKFEDFPNIQIVHPVGGFKKYPHVCEHVAKILRNDYPDYYYRIIEMVRGAESGMRSAIYYSPKLKLEILPMPTEPAAIQPPPFKRAKAAIQHLEEKYGLQNGHNDINYTSKAAFLAHPVIGIANEAEKQRLRDVILLDAKHKSMLRLFTAKGGTLNRLYHDDANAYRQIRHIFMQDDDIIGEYQVKKSKHTTVVRQRWAWEHNYDEEIPLVVKRNLKEPAGTHSVALSPNIIATGVREYYFDELDELIFSIANNKIKVNDAIVKMEEYFEPDEIKENYQSYKKLIINSIKHLLYANALSIIEE